MTTKRSSSTTRARRPRGIDVALHRYVEEESRANLRKQLREGAQVRAERDLHLAEEWFALDEEVQSGARR